MNHHVNGVEPCPACEEKLTQAHPTIASWYRENVKPRHADAHISWSFRGKDDQEKAFIERKSKLHFPMSAHNKEDDQHQPCALALDLFQVDYNGMACWPWAYFRTIAEEAKAEGCPIKWGGDWKSIGDADHFEIEKV